MNATNYQMIYFGAVLLIGLVCGWIAFRQLTQLQARRACRLRSQDEPGAVPLFERKKSEQKQQLERMQTRFSITRWTVFLLFLMVGAGLCTIPFAERLSSLFVPLVVAAVSVILGIAFRPFLENLICGLVLCYSKLARIGDTAVVDDVYGVIEDVTLTHCIIKRWDSLRYVVPNSTMLTKEFVNYSLNDNLRWVYVEFWIDYGADLELVEKLAIESPKKSQYFADTEEPRFWVMETAQLAVKCMVAAWATTPADGWMLSHDMRKELFCKMKEHNIYTHRHRVVSSREEPPVQGSESHVSV